MGYYQDLDEDLGSEWEAERDLRELERERQEKERRLKRKIATEVNRQIAKAKTNKARGSKVTVKCKHCGGEFQARVADVNRGWGKYCSKSCKAMG